MEANKLEHLKLIRKTLQAMDNAQKEAIVSKFGIITVDGHPLSVFNTCFLFNQNTGNEVPISMVGGYKQWQKSGRQVKKGTHSFVILVPSVKQIEISETETDLDVNFYSANVFDITQTEEIIQEGTK